jgi:AcrR family transcriptional regulator
MADVMAERGAGAGAVTVADVIARADVSRTVFRELFADREACLLAAFELGVQSVGARMVAAYQSQRSWLDGIRAGLGAFLAFLEEEPALGRLLVIHAMGGGEEVLRRRAEVLATLAAAVDQGRLQVPQARQQPPGVIAEGVVGAVLAVIQGRLSADEPKPLMELFGALASIIVLPYLGPTVARRELARPAPRTGAQPGTSTRGQGEDEGDAAEEGVGARLTYRTARVLIAIGDYPGASNREVAERAGIVDQGQISKLLTRLDARGLIAKVGEGRTRGAPNSWQLSERGEAVAHSARVLLKARGQRRP